MSLRVNLISFRVWKHCVFFCFFCVLWFLTREGSSRSLWVHVRSETPFTGTLHTRGTCDGELNVWFSQSIASDAVQHLMFFLFDWLLQICIEKTRGRISLLEKPKTPPSISCEATYWGAVFRIFCVIFTWPANNHAGDSSATTALVVVAFPFLRVLPPAVSTSLQRKLKFIKLIFWLAGICFYLSYSVNWRSKVQEGTRMSVG